MMMPQRTSSDTDPDESSSVEDLHSRRLLILGAHPDDAEYHAGGLATRYCARGDAVKMVSVTNGAAGHHQLKPDELNVIRRAEAESASEIIGASYEVWDFPDAALQPTLEVRDRIIAEIRDFRPHLVITHRTNDYHPDHRAVGQAVQDASYLVTVPLVVPTVPIVSKDPVVAYMVDLFTKPCSMAPDVLLDIEEELPTIVNMLACHESQFFDFLPFNHGIEIPKWQTAAERLQWLRARYEAQIAPRADHFRSHLTTAFGPSHGAAIRWIEAYEISEYAGVLAPDLRRDLFAMA